MDGSHIVIREANRLRIYSEKGQAHDMFSRILQILFYSFFPTHVIMFLFYQMLKPNEKVYFD